MLLSLGVGGQFDQEMDDSAVGLGGLNIGIGGFLSRNLALMFRISGTNVDYDLEELGDDASVNQISGVGAISMQYWLSDKFNIEAGPGFGMWLFQEDVSDEAFGLFVGAGWSVFQRGKSNLQVGLEYAPVFTESAVQNLGICLAYQLL